MLLHIKLDDASVFYFTAPDLCMIIFLGLSSDTL